MHMLFTLALFSGMRQSELLGLTWDNIDFDSQEITVEKQIYRQSIKDNNQYFVPLKNDKIRIIAILQFITDMLADHKQAQDNSNPDLWHNPHNLVFTTPTGSRMNTSTVYSNFKHIADQIGIPAARFHDLRHTYAVLSLQQGDDIKTVQHNLGHATASFTLDIYGHVSQKMKADSAARMDAYFKDISGHKG